MAQKRTDLLQDARDGVLDALADTIERFERHQQKNDGGKRGAPEPEPAPEDAGDFAQDVLRLNLQYLNQLSRLGSSYSVVASRALEKLYDYFGPKDEDETETSESAKRVRSVTGVDGERRQVPIVIRNQNPFKVNVQIETIGGPKIELRVDGRALADDEKILLLPREEYSLSARIEFSALKEAQNVELCFTASVEPKAAKISFDPQKLVLKRVRS